MSPAALAAVFIVSGALLLLAAWRIDARRRRQERRGEPYSGDWGW